MKTEGILVHEYKEMVNGQEKLYGRLHRRFDGELVYYSDVNRKKHFCFKYQGWGIQCWVARDLMKRGCWKAFKRVEEDDKSITHIWISPYTLVHNGAEDDLGEGFQYFMPEVKWHKRESTSIQTTL